MLIYLIKRILLGLISLIIFLFALFLVVELAVPGDVATPLRLSMTAEEVDEVREQIGVTRPLPVRFWDWLSVPRRKRCTRVIMVRTTRSRILRLRKSRLRP